MTPTEDWKLIRRYVDDGSDEAFGEIVRRYTKLVYTTCRREFENAQSAEDATQAVFILLAEKAGSLRQGSVLTGWLFNAARLVAHNAIRRERRYARMIQAAPASAPSPVDRDLSIVLNDALGALAERDQNAVLLRFYQELSLAEVGAHLGVSEAAAGQCVSRAIDRLRRGLRKAGVVVAAVALIDFLRADGAQAAPANLASEVAASTLGRPAAPQSDSVRGLVRGATDHLMRLSLARTTAALVALALLLAFFQLARPGTRSAVRATARTTSAMVTPPRSGAPAAAKAAAVPGAAGTPPFTGPIDAGGLAAITGTTKGGDGGAAGTTGDAKPPGATGDTATAPSVATGDAKPAATSDAAATPAAGTGTATGGGGG
jgi:RNA polymerase sigma factor (sigma-70 family)